MDELIVLTIFIALQGQRSLRQEERTKINPNNSVMVMIFL